MRKIQCSYAVGMVESWMGDTSPEMLRVLLDLHARMGEQARLKHVFELCDFERGFTEASLRRLYPEADERELFLRSTARRLDRELMIKVYDWDPEVHR